MDFGTLFFIGGMVFLMWPMVEFLSDGGIKENIFWLIVVTIATFVFGAILAFGK